MIRLHEFNKLDAAEAAALLRPCLDVDRWGAGIVNGRPYASADDLFAAARSAAEPLTGAEVEAALAHHPRIGERASGATAEAGMSRSEQAALVLDDDVESQLAEGNQAYERRFGRIFLIRAAGRSSEEILAKLRTRLGNDPDTEHEVVADQLRQIALVRLAGGGDGVSHLSAHVLDAAAGAPAAGVEVTLAHRSGKSSGESIASATTNADGRVGDLGPDHLEPGDYQVTFGSGAYYATRGVDCFYPVVTVVFTVAADQPHYHVPLLLSPYSYTTYRGS